MSSARGRSPFERWLREGPPARVWRFVTHDIWLIDITNLSKPLAFLTRVVRVIFMTVRGFERDRCLQQSAALTYITIFTLPAVLAFAFALAKGFNVYTDLKTNTIDPFLEKTFGPTGEGGSAGQLREAVDQIFSYVENTDLRALGSFALIFMAYSAIKLLGATERSLNEIWGVQRARSFLRRITDYLAIVVVTPIFLVSGAALTAILKTEGLPLLDGEEVSWIVGFVPTLSIWFGFAFVYLTLPNTRVSILGAILGGVAGGSLWLLIQSLLVSGQIALTRYNAVYSSFAAIPVLLFWIYLSWVVMLVGAELAFSIQNARVFAALIRTGRIDQDYRERLAPRLMGRITRAFLDGSSPPSAAALAGRLGVTPRAVTLVLDALVQADLVAQTSEKVEDGYLPARDPETITVLDLLHALRNDRGAAKVPTKGRLDERVDRILDALDEEQRGSVSNYTMTELARAVGAGNELVEPKQEGETRAAESPSP